MDGSAPAQVDSRAVRYRFGQFELNAERYELVRSGRKLAVQPKVFDILHYLLERRERLVTKQELLDALWEGQHVNETAVPWTISHARRAIGQRSGHKTPIETVYGRGYRWCCPVDVDYGPPTAKEALRRAPPFVGRDVLMAALRERLLEAGAGRGGFCLLVGDAGIGKTRCMEELASVARADGFAVWAGPSAQRTLTPAYFPWIALLRAAVHDAPASSELTALLSRLEAVDDRQVYMVDRDAVLGRLSLFEEANRLLIECGRRVPLLLLLDDLHCADTGTLELLSFVAAELRRARVLVLGATREPLAHGGAPRTGPTRYAERFDLGPLSAEAVARYLHALTAGVAPGRELCEAVHRASAGYPLFVEETLRELRARHRHGRLESLPTTSVQPSACARDVLGGRLSAFDEITRRALAYASVLGDGFDVTSLSRLCGIPVDALLQALDGARHAGFVAAAGVHGFRFRHGLFRDVAYEQMTADERMRLHRAAAVLLQSAPDAAQRRTEIAHHHDRSLAGTSTAHHRRGLRDCYTDTPLSSGRLAQSRQDLRCSVAVSDNCAAVGTPGQLQHDALFAVPARDNDEL